MKNFILLVATIIIGAAITYFMDYSSALTPVASNISIAQGEIAPGFSFIDQNGVEHSIHDFKGKIVVLNFWASWCPPCIKEMPYFMQLAAEFPDDVVFIGLSSDIQEQAMVKFLNKLKSDHEQSIQQDNVLFAFDKDTAITGDIFRIYKLPETIMIDKKGFMQDKLIGANWGYEDLVRKLDLLNNR